VTHDAERDRFIKDHIAVCTAGPCKKYDPKKPGGGGYHSVEYSRRKCAKAIWKREHAKLEKP